MRLTKWKTYRTHKRLYKANKDISISDLTWKLGHYEDIDENPEHLAKIKKALEKIKNFKNDKYSVFKIAGNTIYIDVMLTLDDDEIELLKEVLS